MAGAAEGGGGSSPKIVVVGGGLAGCLTALLLARRKTESGAPFAVCLMEGRPDFRAVERERAKSTALGGAADSIKRSINLALSYRGQEGLRRAGLLEKVMPTTVPMSQRVMHSSDGSLSFQPYGTHGECIYSVSREDLNRVLLDELEKLENVELAFGRKVAFVKPPKESGAAVEIRMEDGESVAADIVIGADGAFSKVRASMLRHSPTNFSRHFIEHLYRELDIPGVPVDGEGGEDEDEGGSGLEFALPHPQGLHIWPRPDKRMMLIALPNADKSFTCTMFAPREVFAELDAKVALDDGSFVAWFRDVFPDAAKLIPSLERQFKSNPAGALVTVRSSPWNLGSSLLLIGDAAHAVVPFFGQGMNCAFEDALMLDEALDEVGGSLAAAIPLFAARRQPQADALADLSYHNYLEMRAHVADPFFLAQKRIEAGLHTLFPSWWIPLYHMVAFTRIPYDEARDRGRRQDEALSATARIGATALVLGAALGSAYLISRSGGLSNLFEAARRMKNT